MKKNVFLVISLFFTVVLVIAIGLTVYRMSQKESVAPTAPESKPKAEAVPTHEVGCELAFNAGGATATPTPTGSPTPTGTLTPTVTPTLTATPVPGCYDECETDDDCPSDLVCEEVGGDYLCVNEECPEESNCDCPEETTPTPTPTEGEEPTPTPTESYEVTPTPTTYYGEEPTPTSYEVKVPPAGVVENTVLVIGAGLVFLLAGLLLVL